MAKQLEGKRIAFLATDGFEQIELEQPWNEIKNAGAAVELLSVHKGSIQGMHHLDKGELFEVDELVAESDAADYDGLVLPGGVANPDTLRMNHPAVQFVREFFAQEKPVAAICHGPWMLCSTQALKGRKATCFFAIKDDVINAGGKYVDAEVIRDGNIITSRKPDDLPAFMQTLMQAAKEGKPALAGAR